MALGPSELLMAPKPTLAGTEFTHVRDAREAKRPQPYHKLKIRGSKHVVDTARPTHPPTKTWNLSSTASKLSSGFSMTGIFKASWMLSMRRPSCGVAAGIDLGDSDTNLTHTQAKSLPGYT